MNLGNCVLVNAYSYHNAGDAAIMIASEQLMTDLGAESVVLSSRYADSDSYSSHGIRVVPEILRFPARGDSGAASRVATFLWAAARGALVVGASKVSRKFGKFAARVLLPTSARLLSDFETLVVAGGGYMYSSRRVFNMSLWHSLLTIRVAQAMLEGTVMMPQSIGPVKRRIDAFLIDWALRNTTVVVREKVSFSKSTVLPRVAVRAKEIHDVAFYLKDAPFDSTQSAEARLVRVVVMDWRWSTSVREDAFAEYLRELARFIDDLHENGYVVEVGGHSVIPEHAQDDVEIARLVASACTRPPVVDENCDVQHLLNRYRSSALVVGTRLHACIMSISQGTPAIALAYQEKTTGVMAALGLGDFVFQADSLNADELGNAVAHALSDESPDIKVLARSIREKISSFYEEVIS